MTERCVRSIRNDEDVCAGKPYTNTWKSDRTCCKTFLGHVNVCPSSMFLYVFGGGLIWWLLSICICLVLGCVFSVHVWVGQTCRSIGGCFPCQSRSVWRPPWAHWSCGESNFDVEQRPCVHPEAWLETSFGWHGRVWLFHAAKLQS